MTTARGTKRFSSRPRPQRRPRSDNRPNAPRGWPNAPTAIVADRVSEPVVIPPQITVADLAALLGVSAIDIVKQLIKQGVMANVNQTIDHATAATVARALGNEVLERPLPEAVEPGKTSRRIVEQDVDGLVPRPPVVTIMGHVDHGKTSLLDVIRKSNLTEREFGGITQHIGAYQVEVDGEKITFIDTPGHEAFTTMRARGAQVTDIAVIVVAADDGVMPQTIEAIGHARAADVPIIVAINKIDKPDANPDRVKQQLAEHGVVIEEYGGDVPSVEVSARRKEGIDDLLANILVVAEISELRANVDRLGVGVVIEAKLDKSRGPLATVLVQTGRLHEGDYVLAGASHGRVRAMLNERGQRVKVAEPSTPVEILGLNQVPEAGDALRVVADEKQARILAQEERERRHGVGTTVGGSLEDIAGQIREGQLRELLVVVKTDVQGSVEPVRSSLEKVETENAKLRVILAGAGSVNESDVMLASASKAVVVAFNARVEPGAERLAETEGVEIRHYNVIYSLVEDMDRALRGMLEPKYAEVVEGHAEVRQVFRIGRRATIAGCYVTDGKVTRNSTVRVRRDKEQIAEGKIGSLKRFKEDVREVVTGYECGITVDGFSEFQEGDILEFYGKVRVS